MVSLTHESKKVEYRQMYIDKTKGIQAHLYTSIDMEGKSRLCNTT